MRKQCRRFAGFGLGASEQVTVSSVQSLPRVLSRVHCLVVPCRRAQMGDLSWVSGTARREGS